MIRIVWKNYLGPPDLLYVPKLAAYANQKEENTVTQELVCRKLRFKNRGKHGFISIEATPIWETTLGNLYFSLGEKE